LDESELVIIFKELWTPSWIGGKLTFELLWFPVLEKEAEDAATLKGNKEAEFLSW
jgi:hypothetical protein